MEGITLLWRTKRRIRFWLICTQLIGRSKTALSVTGATVRNSPSMIGASGRPTIWHLHSYSLEIVHGALHRFDLEHGIGILNKVYRPKEYRRFCEMAEFLGVSKQAMVIRLKRLGLLKKDYLQNPYALADVEKEDDD